MEEDKERSKRMVLKFLESNPKWSAKANVLLWKMRTSDNITETQFKYVLDKWGRKTYNTEDIVRTVFGSAIK